MHHFEDEFCEIWETIISPNHHFCEFRVPCFLENHHFSFRLRKPSFWWEVWVAQNEAGLRRFPARLRLQNQTTFWNFKQHFLFQIISNFTSFLGGLAARKTIIFCEAASPGGKPSFLRIIIFANLKYPSKINENHHFCESKKTIICSNRYCNVHRCPSLGRFSERSANCQHLISDFHSTRSRQP